MTLLLVDDGRVKLVKLICCIRIVIMGAILTVLVFSLARVSEGGVNCYVNSWPSRSVVIPGLTNIWLRRSPAGIE